jgi:pimeloyl-ACP methyl ester carboxylesterase
MQFHNDGLRFEATSTGPVDGRTIIALHGFPNDRTAFDAVGDRLAASGYRVLAPDQRGYSAGARPPHRRDYRLSCLVGDILSLADQAGADRFDLVGHDWGAVVAYHLAARHPNRVRTVTALSAPHPGAWLRSLVQSTQALRSGYMAFFQLPVLPERMLAGRSGDRLRRALVGSGLNADHARRYATRAAEPGGLTGPLHWYRAIPYNARRIAHVPVPTTLIYGDEDQFITSTAAELTGRWITGPYELQVWKGVSHWIPEQEPDRLAAAIGRHVATVPADQPAGPPARFAGGAQRATGSDSAGGPD